MIFGMVLVVKKGFAGSSRSGEYARSPGGYDVLGMEAEGVGPFGGGDVR